jgi:hypothetical protein
MTRVPIRYSPVWAWLLTILGLPARWADVRINGERVRVRMSWAFRARFDRANVTSVRPYRPCVSVGVHGFRGRWLVNGANRPIARITFAEPVRARVIGFPVALRELLVSVDDVVVLERLLVSHVA